MVRRTASLKVSLSRLIAAARAEACAQGTLAVAQCDGRRRAGRGAVARRAGDFDEDRSLLAAARSKTRPPARGRSRVGAGIEAIVVSRLLVEAEIAQRHLLVGRLRDASVPRLRASCRGPRKGRRNRRQRRFRTEFGAARRQNSERQFAQAGPFHKKRDRRRWMRSCSRRPRPPRSHVGIGEVASQGRVVVAQASRSEASAWRRPSSARIARGGGCRDGTRLRDCRRARRMSPRD